ncbi:uncharacterized protein B0I36DRAFT_311842 [Microdochium trichocladiopsis]|uniref:Uncharacterized protein n=1 Tax=Microdochium trichocladiopsis TaxID=1682393 RepID=A0A9P9BW38_9PEZI|nr:uncharacterized protein B0I36DRAFT_311842 [Microdochium trichocladiopsis]KAH7040963.1 hypothetical protein B0I36DRAFT_311842 [Microdochium trichocladiopsis]
MYFNYLGPDNGAIRFRDPDFGLHLQPRSPGPAGSELRHEMRGIHRNLSVSSFMGASLDNYERTPVAKVESTTAGPWSTTYSVFSLQDGKLVHGTWHKGSPQPHPPQRRKKRVDLLDQPSIFIVFHVESASLPTDKSSKCYPKQTTRLTNIISSR